MVGVLRDGRDPARPKQRTPTGSIWRHRSTRRRDRSIDAAPAPNSHRTRPGSAHSVPEPSARDRCHRTCRDARPIRDSRAHERHDHLVQAAAAVVKRLAGLDEFVTHPAGTETERDAIRRQHGRCADLARDRAQVSTRGDVDGRRESKSSRDHSHGGDRHPTVGKRSIGPASPDDRRRSTDTRTTGREGKRCDPTASFHPSLPPRLQGRASGSRQCRRRRPTPRSALLASERVAERRNYLEL